MKYYTLIIFSTLFLFYGCKSKISTENKVKSDEYLIKALDNKKDNNHEQAIIYLNLSIELNPENAKAYKYRAMYRKDDNKFILEDYNKCIQLDSNDYESYYYRALTKENEFQDISGALQDLDKAIIINSKYLNAIQSRGRINLNKKNYNIAIVDFEEAFRIDPKDTDTKALLGEAYYHTNQKEIGCAFLRDACSEGNENACISLKYFINCNKY